MKKIKFLFLFIAISFTNIYSSSFNATISIDTNKVKNNIVTNKLFGGFTEFLLDYINSPNGLWAQEFMDRGFDIERPNHLTSEFWTPLIKDSDNHDFSLKSGGYNENGRWYQHIQNYSIDGELGVYQFITYDDTTELDVYAYLRSDDFNSKAFIKVLDENLNELYKQEIENLNEIWTKKTFTIKKISGYSRLAIYFGIEGKGDLNIDEASAMPSNNVNGVRKEYFDLFKNWNMGTLRWPGGSFADYYTTRWYYSIGDIDKRKAPLYGDRGYKQRMDFGLHEFMSLCDTLNIEPYLTTNFRTGTIEEAANWIKYCNYDTSDYYGKMRFKNGSLNPFNVEYWEIGNEQWYYGSEYAKGYVPYYDSLIKVDSNIKFILATDVWPGKVYFDSTMDIIGDKADIYGYHPILFSIPTEPVTDTDIYLNTVGLPVNYEFVMKELNKWINERKLNDKIKQGSTEWGFGYSNFPELLYDTISRASSLENGLFYASNILSYIRNADFLHMSNVTIGYGFIRRGFNSINGKRSIVGAPSYQMLAMLSRHFGADLLEFTIECPFYSTSEIKGFWSVFQQKWLDIAITKNKDSIFIAVVNKNPNDSGITNIVINNYIPDSIFVHQYKSNHFLDANTFDEPNKIVPTSFIAKYDGTFSFPKHSLTILAIPLNYKKITIDTNITDTNKILVEFKLYPNPANKTINIDFNDEIFDFKGLTVFDVIGKEYVPEFKLINKNKLEVNISELKTGKYFIKFTGSKKSVTKEFLIIP